MTPLSDFSIFLVDDDPFFIGICEKMLINLGYKQITSFQSGSDFLQKIHLNPDIILLDYHMYAMNGLETLINIKRYNSNSLVVFISGQEDIEVAVSALKFGAFDYLVKNQISEERLKKVLDSGVALNSMIRKNYRKTVIRRVLSTIGIPILVWVLLETLFK